MATKVVVPELGESIVEATVRNWLKQEGDRVSVGEAVVELETDKVDLEVGASQDGILARIEVQAGEDVNAGDILAVIEDLTEDGQKPPEEPEVEAEVTAEAEPEEIEKEGPGEMKAAERAVEPEAAAEEGLATPVARRIAQEHGLDLSRIKGTGSNRRITKEDVERYLQMQKQEAEEKVEPAPAATISPVTPDGREGLTRAEERVRMSRRRRTIARRMVEAQRTAAILTTFNDVDMSAVMELRKRKRDSFQERYGVKLGIMSFFVKASIAALKAFPQLNAELRGEDNEELILKYYYDIGIAIGAEEGLIVPVLRDAERMSFAEIEKSILEYVQRSRDGTLSLEDLRGGTFSITNGGVFGSLLSTPILNPPQTGILGLHRIEERPVAINGQIVIRPMMYLALSYDHRVVDGREAVQFLVRLKEFIEEPAGILLES